MAFDPEKLLNKEFPTVQQTYVAKDCMLYALGVGMGIDPLDEQSLRFVYEENLKVLPSQSVMMSPQEKISVRSLQLFWPEGTGDLAENVRQPRRPISSQKVSQI